MIRFFLGTGWACFTPFPPFPECSCRSEFSPIVYKKSLSQVLHDMKPNTFLFSLLSGTKKKGWGDLYRKRCTCPPLYGLPRTLDNVEHPDKNRYPNQKVYLVERENYIYAVPFIIDDDTDVIFLKTIFPSRKYTRKYLQD